MAQARLQGPGSQLAKPLEAHLDRIVEAGGVEQERGHQRLFLRCFEQGVEAVAARPAVVLEFPEEPVEQHPRRVLGVDPVVGQGGAQGLADPLAVQAQQEQVRSGVGSAEAGGSAQRLPLRRPVRRSPPAAATGRPTRGRACARSPAAGPRPAAPGARGLGDELRTASPRFRRRL